MNEDDFARLPPAAQAFYEQEVVKAFDELTHELSARSFWRVRAEAP
jgi:hypothetical protein